MNSTFYTCVHFFKWNLSSRCENIKSDMFFFCQGVLSPGVCRDSMRHRADLDYWLLVQPVRISKKLFLFSPQATGKACHDCHAVRLNSVLLNRTFAYTIRKMQIILYRREGGGVAAESGQKKEKRWEGEESDYKKVSDPLLFSFVPVLLWWSLFPPHGLLGHGLLGKGFSLSPSRSLIINWLMFCSCQYCLVT